MVIAIFQLALALGAPFGSAAWGGKYPGKLPRQLRISSAVAVVVWLILAIVVLARAGLGPIALPEGLTYWATWGVVLLSIVGAVVNFASSSRYERFGWGPFASLLAVLTLIVALS